VRGVGYRLVEPTEMATAAGKDDDTPEPAAE
jgi:hypothetical protein